MDDQKSYTVHCANITRLVVIGINRRLNSQMKGWIFVVSDKEIRDAKNYSAIPLSNESVKKKRNNLLKSVIGASVIATGLTMMPQASFAQVAEQPPAIVQREAVAEQAPAAKATEAAPSKAPASATEGTPAASDEKKEGAAEAQAPEAAPADVAEPVAEPAPAPETNLETSEETPTEAQKAPEEVTEPNYADDEAKIEDYDEKNDYKKTDLQQGDTTQVLNNGDAGAEAKDGFKFETSNPSATSESLTEYGYAIVIDKKTGQRTYTLLYVTDTGRIAVKTGDKPMMEEGDKLHDGSPEVTYKPKEDASLTESGRQKNYNWAASDETLKHINNAGYTVIGMKDDYDQDNPKLKFFDGVSFQVVYKVNPWPNENDKLELMELSGEYKEKVFVQGQDIDTGVKVDNMDENAKERIVGQVYNPITGDIVPGASAYIGDDGNVHIQLPEGALKKDENGKYVVNEDSIFNTDDYKALQNLEVKFFARPRTKDEFSTIAETDEYTPGTYVGTDAGSEVINHKGEDVTIDKQGIDRYDHYNLIGTLKIDLDDTRYYDQNFKDGNGDDTSDITSSAVKPGVEFEVGIYEKDNPGEYDKSADDMNGAESRGEAAGVLNMDFIDKLNEGKAEEDQWKVIVDPNDITKFKVIAPQSAKAGDFAAIPVEYTYTNGSKDTHWFHFVVQESDNVRPEYDVQVDYPTAEQTSPADVRSDGKKLEPDSYSIPEGTEFKDDKGNEWTVTIDEKTGQVTAKPVDPKAFKGGEKLQVPVIAHYTDPNEPDKVITEETKAEFVIKEKTNTPPDYSAQVGKAGEELSSTATINKDEDDYNRTPNSYSLPDTVLTDEAGNRYVLDDNGYKWIVNIDPETGEVKATVPYGVGVNYALLRGTIINVPVEAHYINQNGDDAGTEETSVQFVATGEDLNHIQYDAKKGKASDTLESDVILDDNKYERQPVKYTIDQTEYTDDKGNVWTVSIDEITGKVTAIVPKAAEGETIDLDGTMINVPVTAHYEDANGNIIGKKKANVQFLGSGTQGTHRYTENIPFETKVEVVKDLAPGEWRYKIIDGVEQKGKNGSVTKEITIKDSKVEGKARDVDKVDPVNAIIEIGKADYTGTVTHTETIETPFEVEYEYSTELEAGQAQIKQKGEKGSYDLVYSQKIKNGEADGKATTNKENIKEAKKEIIVIGIKPVEKVVETPFDTEYIYDDTMEAGKEEEVTAGKNGSTKTTTSYDQKENKLVNKEEKTDPTNRVVKVGIKPVTEEVETDYKTIIEYDPNLDSGKVEETPGEKGKTTITTSYDKDKNELVTKEEKVDPKDKVVRIGIKPVVTTEPIPFEKEYEHDPNLKAGTIELISEGKPGTATITTTFNKETGKLETTVTRTEPTPAKYKYGSNTKGTVVVESDIPYEVVFVPDDTMAAGETKVTQEGELGKKETTITIENSKEVGKRQDVITKEPVKKIVKYGTLCKVPTPDPDKPDKPDQPDTPSGGDNPGDKPNEPGTPSNPGDKPNEPGTPGNPGDKPNEPGTPDNPGDKPNEPGTPGNPGDKPNEPSTPDNPTTPDKPSTPDNPTTPDQPTNPEQPTTSDKLTDSERTTVPNTTKDDREAPQTFDPGVAAPAGLAALASGLLVGLESLKRRKRD